MNGKLRHLGFGLAMTLLLTGSGLPADADDGDNKRVSTPAEQKSVSITIYNNNLGLVKDVRTLSLPKGLTALTF